MKRLDLIRHLERHGCEFLREGGNHTIYVNRTAKKYPPGRVIVRLLSSLHERSARISMCRFPDEKPATCGR
jgi:hypothetical protein